jgi:hypothetical protein
VVQKASAQNMSIRDFINLLVIIGAIPAEKMPAVNAYLATLGNTSPITSVTSQNISTPNNNASPTINSISLNGSTFKAGSDVSVTWHKSGNFSTGNYYFVYLKESKDQILGNNNPVQPVSYYPLIFRQTTLGYPTFSFTLPTDQNVRGGSPISPGSYYLEIDFTDSNANVITTITSDSFDVISSVSAQPFLNISNPLDGHLWTVGDTQTFRWSTSGISSDIIGHIDLVNSNGVAYRISNVPNTGSYAWSPVGTINGSLIPTTGNYSVKIIMNNIGDIVGPLTIAEKQSQPINIDVNYSVTSNENGYKKYVLDLSGGTFANPVKWWNLKFTCPSNISEVNAKVAGNVCTGEDYKLGKNEVAGDIEIPFDVHYLDFNVANLKIHIKAIGNDDNIMNEIDYVIPVHKG